MNTLKLYNISISSSMDQIRDAVCSVIAYLKRIYGPMCEDTVFELKVILNELIVNAVKHGNKQDCSKMVKICAGIIRQDYAFIAIEDEGQGYDYEYVCKKYYEQDEISEWSLLNESGRGLMIVSNLCDNVYFNKAGNKVMVFKKLSRT